MRPKVHHKKGRQNAWSTIIIKLSAWYQLDWWLVWLPSCRLHPSLSGAVEGGSRFGGDGGGDHGGIGDQPAHSTVYIVGSGSSALFFFSLFPHLVGTRAHGHFSRLSLLFRSATIVAPTFSKNIYYVTSIWLVSHSSAAWFGYCCRPFGTVLLARLALVFAARLATNLIAIKRLRQTSSPHHWDWSQSPMAVGRGYIICHICCTLFVEVYHPWMKWPQPWIFALTMDDRIISLCHWPVSLRLGPPLWNNFHGITAGFHGWRAKKKVRSLSQNEKTSWTSNKTRLRRNSLQVYLKYFKSCNFNNKR